MTVDAKELAMRPKKPKPEDGEGKKLSHGKMHGLNNDDHAHYLTADRGDKRYYTKTEIDIFFGGLAGDFYTNERVEDSLAAVEKSFTALLESRATQDHVHETEHDVGHLHDLIQTKADEDHVHHEIYSKVELDNGVLNEIYYTNREVDAFIEWLRLALKDKSPIGHKHAEYYSKGSLDSVQLDKLYFSKKE